MPGNYNRTYGGEELMENDGSKEKRGMTKGQKVNLDANFKEVDHSNKPKATQSLPSSAGFLGKK